MVELTDKNFAAILSDDGAVHGAGTLAIINRSVGIDQLSTTPEDYVQQPDAIDWPNPAFFQHSMHLLDPAATGKLAGTQGAYRSPSLLPNAEFARQLRRQRGRARQLQWQLRHRRGRRQHRRTHPADHGRRKTSCGRSPSPRATTCACSSRGSTNPTARRKSSTTTTAAIAPRSPSSMCPLLSSLLFQNTRTGRVVPTSNFALSLWEDLPPEPGVTSFDAADPNSVFSDDYGKVYVRRGLLGCAAALRRRFEQRDHPRRHPARAASARDQLAADTQPTDHFQREEMQFYPGEVVRQGFRRPLFNGLCAGCHGSVSGYETDISANPDILTQASRVEAKDHNPVDLTNHPSSTMGPVAP